VVLALIGGTLALGCEPGPSKPDTVNARPLSQNSQACDSVRAARVALDSLARLDRFKSAIYRYEPDSAGVRIVTWPAPNQPILDGMAVIRLDRTCRITNLVQTDSA